MNETANILRSSSEKSLIIMDEVGRGTSTNDGLAIAWAVSEYILSTVRAKTMFATHFHELTTLTHKLLINLSMAVLEREGEIVFLKQVKEGPVDNSYGIHVAQLAGIPVEVVNRAQIILSGLEDKEIRLNHTPPLEQSLLFAPTDMVRDEIINLDISRTAPLEALNRIARWQKELSSS
jgi:DNA mismatch repair protein MutS